MYICNHICIHHRYHRSAGVHALIACVGLRLRSVQDSSPREQGRRHRACADHRLLQPLLPGDENFISSIHTVNIHTYIHTYIHNSILNYNNYI